jgi:hypothetical protein
MATAGRAADVDELGRDQRTEQPRGAAGRNNRLPRWQLRPATVGVRIPGPAPTK